MKRTDVVTRPENEDYWIFGYGISLIWKPPPSYVRRIPCYIKSGYIRRFWQASEDHRGVPEAPGRVVTLIEADTDEPVWGVAYLIAPNEVDAIKEYCDIREINGYTVHEHPVYHNLTESQFNSYRSKNDTTRVSFRNPITAILYVGTPDNPQYTGPPKSAYELANHILESRGPSGENKEYLYRLEESLEELAPEAHDEHISELCTIAKGIEEGMVHWSLGGHDQSQLSQSPTQTNGPRASSPEDAVGPLVSPTTVTFSRDRSGSFSGSLGRARAASMGKAQTFQHPNYRHGRRPSQVEEPIEENEKK